MLGKNGRTFITASSMGFSALVGAAQLIYKIRADRKAAKLLKDALKDDDNKNKQDTDSKVK